MSTNYDQLLGLGLRVEKASALDRLHDAMVHSRSIAIARWHNPKHDDGFPAWKRFNRLSEAYRLSDRDDLGMFVSPY